MATAAKPKTTTKTTARKTTASRTTAAKSRAASARAKAAKPAAEAPQAPSTPAERARAAADEARRQVERALAVQVGAVLEVRDNVLGTVEDIQSRYGTAAAAEKQVKRFEKRGERARKQAERRIKRNRTKVERELKSRRRTAERRIKTERKRVEKEARTAIDRANGRADAVRDAIRSIDLANVSVPAQVGQVVQTGTQAVRRVSERVSAQS